MPRPYIDHQQEMLEDEEENASSYIIDDLEDDETTKLVDDLFLTVHEFCDERSLPIAEFLDREAIRDILFRMYRR